MALEIGFCPDETSLENLKPMTILRVLEYPDPRLLLKAEQVQAITPEIVQYISDMFETMYDEKGVGLAATQVGIPLQLFVMDVSDKDQPPEPKCLINPVYLARGGEQEIAEEGCLSFPGLRIQVPRYHQITLEYRDEHFEKKVLQAEGFQARCIQHETDHLDGEVFVNRLSMLKKQLALKRYEKIHRDD